MRHTECAVLRNGAPSSSCGFWFCMLASVLAMLLCFDVGLSNQRAASLAKHPGRLSAFISSSLVKRLPQSYVVVAVKDWRCVLEAGEDKRGRLLPVSLWHPRFMTCGTDVFREESSATAEGWMHSLWLLLMRPGCDFSRVRGHRGWTQPVNLLSAVLLEEISLVSWTKNVSPISKRAERQKCFSWFPGSKLVRVCLI